MLKYTYKHKYCDREMSKEAFLDKLSIIFKGDELDKKYSELKRTNKLFYHQGHWFIIKKERI